MEKDNSSDVVNLYAELGVSDKRSHEISTEIRSLRKGSEKLTELLAGIPKGYDRESIIVGVFLAEIILGDTGRLLPRGSTIASKDEMAEMIAKILDEIESGDISPKAIMCNPGA